ncbi:Gfo/Idh/MocA family oxidoreductase [Patescibacteria group bacterium]|nr:Gfo/Idh/MocA family oxidoreductase [Patescibacteria group bacterium]
MPLRVGLIGLGHQATGIHIPALLSMRQLEIVGLTSADHQTGEEISKNLQKKYFYNVEELLATAKPDFVIIAVPHSEYFNIIQKVAARKIHILKEKPLSLNLKEGKKLLKIAEQNEIEIMIGLQRRFNPVYKRFKEEVKKEKNIFFFEGKYSIAVDNPHEGWRGDKKLAGGGCTIDMGYHMIDLLVWYFGLPDGVICEYSCKAKPGEKYDAEDTAAMLIKYKDKYGTLNISRVIPPKTEYIKAVSSNKVIEVRDGDFLETNLCGNIIEKIPPELSKIDIAKREIQYFCNVVEKKAKNEYDIKYHLQHMAFVESCYNSFESKKLVNPNLFL